MAIRLALEEDFIPDADGGDDTVTEAQLDQEETSGELVQDDAEIGNIDEAVSNTDSDMDTVDEMSEVAQESIRNGDGLTPDAARIMSITMESICNRLGVSAKHYTPSLESFNSRSSRVTATRVALEGFSDFIRKAWEAIKRAFTRIGEFIVEMFYKIFKNVDSLEKTLKSLEKRVASSSKDTRKPFTSSKLEKGFNGDVTVKGVTAVKDAIKKYNDNSSAKNGGLDKLEKAAALIKDNVAKGNLDHIFTLQEEWSADMSKITKEVLLPYGKHMVIEADDHEEKGTYTHAHGIGGSKKHQFFKVYTKVEPFTPTKKEIPALTQAEMGTVINFAKDFIAPLRKIKEIGGSVKNAVTKLNNAIDGIIKEMVGKESKDDSTKDTEKAARRVVNYLGQKTLMQVRLSFVAMWQFCNLVITFVNESLGSKKDTEANA